MRRVYNQSNFQWNAEQYYFWMTTPSIYGYTIDTVSCVAYNGGAILGCQINNNHLRIMGYLPTLDKPFSSDYEFSVVVYFIISE